MVYFWSILLVLLNTVWLVLVFFALPGNWLIVISTGVFAWWRWEDGVFSIYTLIALFVLALLGEVIEFLGGFGGAKKAGASWVGSIGALVGAIFGAVFGTFFLPVPILGTLIGACVGAGLGSWGIEVLSGKQMSHSIRSGFGASVGEFVGIVSKFLIGCVIWLIVAIGVFWP